MLSTLLFINNDCKKQQDLKSCLNKINTNTYLISAYSCAEAVRILSLVKPDAVLLDLNLYDIRSYNVLKKLAGLDIEKIPVYIVFDGIASETICSIEADGIYNVPATEKEYEIILNEISDRLCVNSNTIDESCYVDNMPN